MIQILLKPDDVIFGGGVIDSILSKFTYSKYPGEHHACSLAPDTYMRPMNWMGPGTSLLDILNDDYTPKQNSLPIRFNDYYYYYYEGLGLVCKKYYKIKYVRLYTNYSYILKSITDKKFTIVEPVDEVEITLETHLLKKHFKLPYCSTVHSVQ